MLSGCDSVLQMRKTNPASTDNLDKINCFATHGKTTFTSLDAFLVCSDSRFFESHNLTLGGVQPVEGGM